MAAVLGSGSPGPSRLGFAVAVAVSVLLLSAAPARAQSTVERSEGWGDATTILALSAAGLQLGTPRIFYSDPEVTVGWKARWHLSVLAPSMTLVATGFLNEQVLKDAFEGFRPG